MSALPRITAEQNELLTQTGAGTPMGELLRRYWWPIGFTDDLKEKPTFVRLLSEDLVLFRSEDGQLGLIEALCAHRRANLCFGSVTGNGIRCRYHGWVYDRDGNVTQTPGDRARAAEVKQKAYPVEELGGLIFAYLGPAPAPLLPRLHYLVAPGKRRSYVQAFNASNWLAHAENGIDPIHASFLHTDVWKRFVQLPTNIWCHRTEYGMTQKHISRGRRKGEWYYAERPCALPGLVFGGDASLSYDLEAKEGGELPAGTCRWAVPVDDNQTLNIRCYYRPEGHDFAEHEIAVPAPDTVVPQPFAEYRQGRSELGYSLSSDIAEQDAAMLDSMGRTPDRENENLARPDAPIAMLRELLLEQIAVVQAGGDPIGVVRDPTANEMIVRSGIYRWIDDAEKEAIVADYPNSKLEGGVAAPIGA